MTLDTSFSTLTLPGSNVAPGNARELSGQQSLQSKTLQHLPCVLQ